MHEEYSCEQFDALYHAGLDKLWKATELDGCSDSIFDESARQIKNYHKLLDHFVCEDGMCVCQIPGKTLSDALDKL